MNQRGESPLRFRNRNALDPYGNSMSLSSMSMSMAADTNTAAADTAATAATTALISQDSTAPPSSNRSNSNIDSNINTNSNDMRCFDHGAFHSDGSTIIAPHRRQSRRYPIDAPTARDMEPMDNYTVHDNDNDNYDDHHYGRQNLSLLRQQQQQQQPNESLPLSSSSTIIQRQDELVDLQCDNADTNTDNDAVLTDTLSNVATVDDATTAAVSVASTNAITGATAPTNSTVFCDEVMSRGGENNNSHLYRLPNGQVITAKNTIQSHVVAAAAVVAQEGHDSINVNVNDNSGVNAVVADHKGDDSNSLPRLPNGHVITAKNTVQSYSTGEQHGNDHAIVQGIVNDVVERNDSSSSRLPRLPNGQVITAKNTVQSYTEPGNDQIVQGIVNDVGERNGRLPRLPNGQVVTAKNTVQSHHDGNDHVVVKDSVNNAIDSGNGDKNRNMSRPPPSPQPRLFNGQVVTAKNTIQSHHNLEYDNGIGRDSPGPGRQLERDDYRHNNTSTATVAAAAATNDNAAVQSPVWPILSIPAAAAAAAAAIPARPPAAAALPVLVVPAMDVESGHAEVAETATVPMDGRPHHATTNASRGAHHANETESAESATAASVPRHDTHKSVLQHMGAQLAMALILVAITVVTTVLLLDKSSPQPPLPVVSTAPTVVAAPSSSSPSSPSPTLLPIRLVPTGTPQTTTTKEPILSPPPLPAPMSLPTRRPSVPPPTLAPTFLPLTRATIVTNFINSIKLSNGTLTVPRSSSYTSSYTLPLNGTSTTTVSAEQAALSWLVYNDPLQLWPNGTSTNGNATQTQQFRLQQRYALLTLLLQFPEFVSAMTMTNNNNNNSTTMNRFNDSECQWLFVQACATVSTASTLSPTIGETINAVTEIAIINQVTLPTGSSTLSADLGLLTHIVSFDVSYNGMVGTIPWSTMATTAQAWTNLERFDVSNNALTGRLLSPSNASNVSNSLPPLWPKLKWFGVNSNQLTGSLSSTLGTTWPLLELFDVSSNQLTGTIPSSLAQYWKNPLFVFMHKNNLVGSIPVDSHVCANASLTDVRADCDEVPCRCCNCCRDSDDDYFCT